MLIGVIVGKFTITFLRTKEGQKSLYITLPFLVKDEYNLLYHPGLNAAYQIFGVERDFYTLSEWRIKTGLGRIRLKATHYLLIHLVETFTFYPLARQLIMESIQGYLPILKECLDHRETIMI